VRGRTRSFVVKNAQALYVNGFVGLDANGLLVPWTDAASQRFLGVFVEFDKAFAVGETHDGDTSATPPIRGIVDVSGQYLVGVDVAGVTARANIGDLVYSADDNPATLSTTATTSVRAIGWLADFRSTSDMDVQLFTPAEYASVNNINSGTALTDSTGGTAGNTLAAGVGEYVLAIHVTLAQITGAGDVLTAHPLGHKFKINSMDAVVDKVVTTGSKLASLNLEIGTTDLTGGVVALTSANCTPLGARVAGSAVTAANTGSATDTISVEAASVTAFAEGEVILLISITNMDTSDAIASIAAKLAPLFL
jgi:hypothetical protein